MVNSKKMNKSTVAVIALALLLVLSLILSATGAWFTATAEKNEANVEVPNFGHVGITISVDSSESAVYTNNVLEKGAEGWTVKTLGAKRTNEALMPGDVIKGGSYTVKNEKAGETTEDVYYLIKDGKGNLYIHDGSKLVAADAAEDLVVLASDGSFTFVGGEDVLVDPATGNTEQGAEYKGSIASSYKVAAIQVRNIDRATAWAELNTLLA